MMLVYVGMHSIGSTAIFLKEVSESLYMVLCQIISTWTVVFHKDLALDRYYSQFTRLSYLLS